MAEAAQKCREVLALSLPLPSPCKYAIYAGQTEGWWCALHVCRLDFTFCITGTGASTCLCIYMWLFAIYIYTVCLYAYNGSSSYIICLQPVCILLVKRTVREAAGLSAQWPFTSVMLVMPDFLFLSAPQYSCGPGVWRTNAAGVGVGISIFVSVSLFFSVYVRAFIYIHVFQLLSDDPQGLVWIRVTKR